MEPGLGARKKVQTELEPCTVQNVRTSGLKNQISSLKNEEFAKFSNNDIVLVNPSDRDVVTSYSSTRNAPEAVIRQPAKRSFPAPLRGRYDVRGRQCNAPSRRVRQAP